MSIMVVVAPAPPSSRLYQDAVAIALPNTLKMSFPEVEGAVAAHLTRVAREAEATNYPSTTLLAVDWVFARTPEEVEAWVPPHDCDSCRECKTRGIAELAKSDVIICLGTMFCAEPL